MTIRNLSINYILALALLIFSCKEKEEPSPVADNSKKPLSEVTVNSSTLFKFEYDQYSRINKMSFFFESWSFYNNLEYDKHNRVSKITTFMGDTVYQYFTPIYLEDGKLQSLVRYTPRNYKRGVDSISHFPDGQVSIIKNYLSTSKWDLERAYYFTYLENNVITHTTSGDVDEYEYDNHPNPFYSIPVVASLSFLNSIDNGINMSYYLSKNNFIKSKGRDGRVLNLYYEYGENEYPISATDQNNIRRFFYK